MMKRCCIGVTCFVLALALAGLLADRSSADEPESRVFINGKLFKVTFNDGDSFRVVSGSKKNIRARLAGFNTLETHGPVHLWGSWNARELYHLAKMATLHARRGIWKCETKWDLDTYGRTLMKCADLGQELIRLGYAHALSIDDNPADADFLAAQKEAIAAKRGIWAHGIPPFIITSVHTIEESTDGRDQYNRLVSTVDGHSAGWRHRNSYQECQQVCHMVYPVEDAKVNDAMAALKADPRAASLIAGLSDGKLLSLIRDFAAYRHVNRTIAKDKRDAVQKLLTGYAAQGRFGTRTPRKSSCMVHVDFARRYGNRKAECLKK